MIQTLSEFQTLKVSNPKVRLGFNSKETLDNPFFLKEPKKGAIKFDTILHKMKIRSVPKHDSLKSRNSAQILLILSTEISNETITPTERESSVIRTVIKILKNDLERKGKSTEAFEKAEAILHFNLNPAASIPTPLTPIVTRLIPTSTLCKTNELNPSTIIDTDSCTFSFDTTRAMQTSTTIAEEALLDNPLIPDSPRRFNRNSVASIHILKNDRLERAKRLNHISVALKKDSSKGILDLDEVLKRHDSSTQSSQSISTFAKSKTATSPLLKR
jgi:hypothetical protein